MPLNKFSINICSYVIIKYEDIDFKFVNRYRMLEFSIPLLNLGNISRSHYDLFSHVTSIDLKRHITFYDVYNLGMCVYL